MRTLAALVLLLASAPAAAGLPPRLSGPLRGRAVAIGGQMRPGFAASELMLVSRLTLRAELGGAPNTPPGQTTAHGALSLTRSFWSGFTLRELLQLPSCRIHRTGWLFPAILKLL
jgi:hypothetical protein